MIAFVRHHRLAVGLSAVALLAGFAWLAFGFFGVHTLFVDDVVDEAVPTFAVPAAVADEAAVADRPGTTTPSATTDTASDADTEASPAAGATPTPSTPTPPAAASATEPTTPEPTEPAAPEIVTEFRGAFSSEAHPTAGVATVLGNGTDQRFLRFENFETDNGPDLNVYLFDDETGEFVDLGDLTGNIGDQNYEIPADVDLDRFDRVSIWCVRFGVGFGSADLMAT